MSLVTYCKKASIYTLDQKYICDVGVRNIEGDRAVFVFPDDVIDDLWSSIYATFYDTYNGLVTYKCNLSNYKQERITKHLMSYTAECEMAELDAILERRNDIKAYLDIPITISCKDDDTGELLDVPVIIKNISAGGVLFISSQPFYIGQTFKFTFLKGLIPLRLEAEILRSQAIVPPQQWHSELNQEKELICYGCQFINITAREESVVRSFVFREDLKKRKKDL